MGEMLQEMAVVHSTVLHLTFLFCASRMFVLAIVFSTANTAVMQRSVVIYINSSLHLARKYAMICPRTLSVPRAKSFSERKTVSFQEQIMFKDKYPCKFLLSNGG